MNNRVELVNDFLLRKRLTFLQSLPEFLQMALDAFFTRCDDRLETGRFSFSCMGLSYGELSNGEPQKVKPYIPLIFFQGMG